MINRRYNFDKTISDIDAAYLAGFIDADGTISLSKGRVRKDGSRGMPMPLLLIVNTDWRIIEHAKAVTGVGCSYFTKATKLREDQDRKNWNPVHRYQATGIAAIEIVERLLPYIRLKKEQAEVMIMTPQRTRNYLDVASDDDLELGSKLKDRMLDLNARKKKPQTKLDYL
jgi:hypothetical protein